MCAFLYSAFMSYMVVHVHGNVHDLHLHYREYQFFEIVHDISFWWQDRQIYII